MTATPQRETFVCASCGTEHPIRHEGGTGYGIVAEGSAYWVSRGIAADSRICYPCCHLADLESLKTQDRFFAYLECSQSGERVGMEVHNWPGAKLGTVTWLGGVMWRTRFGYDGERRYLRVRDVHGQYWHGTGAAGMYCRLRRRK